MIHQNHTVMQVEPVEHKKVSAGNLLWSDGPPAAQTLLPPSPLLHHLRVSGPQDLGLENICHMSNPLLSTGNTFSPGKEQAAGVWET